MAGVAEVAEQGVETHPCRPGRSRTRPKVYGSSKIRYDERMRSVPLIVAVYLPAGMSL